MKASLIINGQWSEEDGDCYHVTGIDRNGRRFKLVCTSWFHAKGINVWQGSKWLVRDGRRYLIQRISN